MAAPVIAHEGLGLVEGSGWLFRGIDLFIGQRDRLALAIGGATNFVAAYAVAVPFGLPPALGNDLLGLLAMMLVTALPFLALAMLEERSVALWGTALAVTLLLWGWYVVMAIDYRADGSNVLAHMGIDVILFFYPFLLAPILAAMSLVRKRLIRSG